MTAAWIRLKRARKDPGRPTRKLSQQFRREDAAVAHRGSSSGPAGRLHLDALKAELTSFADGFDEACKTQESWMGPSSSIKTLVLCPFPLNIILAGRG